MTHFCSTNKHGFTLVEVMVAIALISLIMTSVYGIFSTISTTQKRLENESEGYHQARMIFDRISRELRTSYLNVNNERSAFTADIDSNGNNYLAFTSTSALTHGNAPGGLVRVRYQLDTQHEKTTGRLLRSAVPLFVPDDPPSGQRLSSQVKQLEWRFFDGSDWQESWDSGVNHRLPHTVEMDMILQCDDREIQVLSAFDLSMPRIDG